MKKAFSIWIILCLFGALALTGCVSRQSASTAPDATHQPSAGLTPAPTVEPTPSPVPFEQAILADPPEYSFCTGYEEVYAALEAIRAAEDDVAPTQEENAAIRASGTSASVTDSLGDMVDTNGSQIFLLSGSDLYILDAQGENSRLLSKTTVGIGWNSEEDGSGGYTGREKVPFAVFCSGAKLAVLSDWYGYETGEGTLSYSQFVSVDIFDVTDPASPVITSSLGQDGSLSAAGVRGDLLYVVSRFEVFDDALAEDLEDYIPSRYVGDQPMALTPEKICSAADGSFAGCSLIGIYDLSGARSVDVQALFGVDADVCAAEDELIFHLSRRAECLSRDVEDEQGSGSEYAFSDVTDLFFYRYDSGSLQLDKVGTLPGKVADGGGIDVSDGVLRVLLEYGRGYYTVYTGDERVDGLRSSGTALCLFDEDLTLTASMDAMPDGSAIGWAGFAGDGVLLTSVDGAVSCTADVSDPGTIVPGADYDGSLKALFIRELGGYVVLYDHNDAGHMTLSVYDPEQNVLVTKTLASDFSNTLDNYRAYLTDAETNIITLTADDSYCVYGYSPEDGIILHFSAYLTDWAWNARGIICGDTLYVADTKEILAYALEGFEQIASVSF